MISLIMCRSINVSTLKSGGKKTETKHFQEAEKKQKIKYDSIQIFHAAKRTMNMFNLIEIDL